MFVLVFLLLLFAFAVFILAFVLLFILLLFLPRRWINFVATISGRRNYDFCCRCALDLDASHGVFSLDAGEGFII